MRTSQPGPPGQATAQWRRWLLPAALAAGFLALATLPRGAALGTALTYTRFLADVGAGTVRTVTIGPAGQVTGSLAGGQPFTTTIPVALGGNGLAGDLAAHHVQVTAAATSSSLLSVLIGLLPLLLIGGLLYVVIRSARRQAAAGVGRMGGLGGLTKAKARVIDAERPTVLGAGQALGYTEMLPADDRRLYGESYLADTLAVRLGGRAAERLIRGEASTGASDDLASATALATQMVREYGLSHKLGPVSYTGPPGGHPALGQRAYSEHTQWLVDQEVADLLTSAETRARDLLTEHVEALNQLTAALLEQETVSGDQVRALAQAASPAPLRTRTPASLPAGSSPAPAPAISSQS